mmetsp:Transcript_13983/g.17336  ORF Transcript_13983/g.17336 Transcript_13983/m.17336 type:complete len:90 (-) Transcript_13983:46-315(-)
MRLHKEPFSHKPIECFDVLLLQGSGKWSQKVTKFLSYELAGNYHYRTLRQRTRSNKRSRVMRKSNSIGLCPTCIIILNKKVTEESLYET